MKLRTRLLAIFTVVTALGTSGMGAAFANSGWHPGYVCNNADYCLYAEGSGNAVITHSSGTKGLTNFQIINQATWGGHTVYEYSQAGNGLCLEYEHTNPSGVVVDYVRMDTCVGGRPSQLWYFNGYNELVNDYWHSIHSTEGCMYEANVYEDVLVEACDTSNGNQLWTFSNGL